MKPSGFCAILLDNVALFVENAEIAQGISFVLVSGESVQSGGLCEIFF